MLRQAFGSLRPWVVPALAAVGSDVRVGMKKYRVEDDERGGAPRGDHHQ